MWADAIEIGEMPRAVRFSLDIVLVLKVADPDSALNCKNELKTTFQSRMTY